MAGLLGGQIVLDCTKKKWAKFFGMNLPDCG